MWERTLNTINRTFEYLTATLLVVMVGLILTQIIARVVIGNSFSWTEELARILMIWITFLGASFAFKYGAHMGIDYFVNKFPEGLRKLNNVLVACVCMLFFAFIFYQGIKLMEFGMLQRTAALKIPMGYVYLIFPISSVLIILNLIDVTRKHIKGEHNLPLQNEQDL